VYTNAGHTAFMRILLAAYSLAAVRVNPMSACLLVVYAQPPVILERNPAKEETFTILPPVSACCIIFRAYFIQSHGALIFIAITLSKLASEYSAVFVKVSPSIAALLIRQSNRVKFAMIQLNKAVISFDFAKSATK